MPRKSSQTDPEPNLDQQLPVDPKDSVLEETIFSQTELESAKDSAADLADIVENPDASLDFQTETESIHNMAKAPGSSAHEDPDQPVVQTGSDITLDTAADSMDQAQDSSDTKTGTETEGNPSPGPAEPGNKTLGTQTETEHALEAMHSEKTDRRRAKKAASSSESDGEAAETNETTTRQSKPARRQRRGEPIVSINAERTVQTDADKLQNDILDLVESLKTKKILTGTIQGVERSEDNPNLSFAVIYHGEFKVIIPADETVKPPEDFRDRSPGDVMHYLITKRLGAEVDFIVKGIDEKTGIAAASRLDAMAAKRREYYYGTDREGNNLLYEGISAEARVVSVIRAGVFADVFGVETYIPLRELSYQRWMDASSHFQAGQRVLVKILSIDRSDRNNIRVSASVKQAGINPYEKALRRYSVGSRYVGTVSMVDKNGVFVSLDGGVDCLCSYPKRGRPPRGSRVTVRILGVNHDSNRIWGAITHMTSR